MESRPDTKERKRAVVFPTEPDCRDISPDTRYRVYSEMLTKSMPDVSIIRKIRNVNDVRPAKIESSADTESEANIFSAIRNSVYDRPKKSVL